MIFVCLLYPAPLSYICSNFTVNSVKIKATQENNPKWGVVGTEDEYCDNVQQN